MFWLGVLTGLGIVGVGLLVRQFTRPPSIGKLVWPKDFGTEGDPSWYDNIQD